MNFNTTGTQKGTVLARHSEYCAKEIQPPLVVLLDVLEKEPWRRRINGKKQPREKFTSAKEDDNSSTHENIHDAARSSIMPNHKIEQPTSCRSRKGYA